MGEPIETVFGPILILTGILLVFAGLIMGALSRSILQRPGRESARRGPLPGDLHWRRGNVRVFFPLGTSLLISIILTLLLNLFLLLAR